MTARCHFCRIGESRIVGLGSARCADCGSTVRACRGCVSIGRGDHTDPRPTPRFTPLEAFLGGGA